MKKNSKAVLFASLTLLSGLIINVMYHLFMDKLGGSFDWLEPYRFGYVLFPLMLLMDILLLVVSVSRALKKKRKTDEPKESSTLNALELSVFSIFTVLTASYAFLTAKALPSDTGFYSPFLVKAALMAVTYLLGTIALAKRSFRFGRTIFLVSAVLCVLGAGLTCLLSTNIVYLFSALLGGWGTIPSVLLLLLVECGPVTLRMLSHAGWMGRREEK